MEHCNGNISITDGDLCLSLTTWMLAHAPEARTHLRITSFAFILAVKWVGARCNSPSYKTQEQINNHAGCNKGSTAPSITLSLVEEIADTKYGFTAVTQLKILQRMGTLGRREHRQGEAGKRFYHGHWQWISLMRVLVTPGMVTFTIPWLCHRGAYR